MGELTTIKIRKETREKLAEIGSKKETYDDIIRRLIDSYKRNNRG
jgi:predicted CopG family antitoxin